MLSVAVNLEAYDSKNLFIEYKNLTQEIVLTWVQNRLGEDEIASLKNYLANNIKNQQTPQVVTLDLPWAIAQPTIAIPK